MDHGNKSGRIAGIRTMRELRQVRREVDMEMYYTGQRFSGNLESLFSIGNLVSLIAPPGSFAERIAGRIRAFAAALRGIACGLRSFRSKL